MMTIRRERWRATFRVTDDQGNERDEILTALFPWGKKAAQMREHFEYRLEGRMEPHERYTGTHKLEFIEEVTL